jgi:cell division protein FtsL
MSKLNGFLTILVAISALALIHVRHESRQLVTAIESAEREARRTQSAHESLQAQRRTLATAERIERLAASRLQMHAPTPGATEYIQNNGQAARGAP